MTEINYYKLNYYGTTVNISKSQEDIKKFLSKFGLTGIRFTEYKTIGVIEFILLKNNKELMFRFKFNVPESEKLQKQVYRALFYYLKNRFLAIEFGIASIEREFLQELVLKLPNGATATIKESLGDKALNLNYNDLKLLEEKEA